MKLKQLRYIWEVAHHNLNVSSTALSLYTSQPGISKQIRLLEDELGVEIFYRNGKHLKCITPVGEQIINYADDILRKIDGIKKMAQEFCDEKKGSLFVAATQTQNRYILPDVLKKFIDACPEVSLKLLQISSSKIVQYIVENSYDFAIFSENTIDDNNILILPCFHWQLAVIVPKDHPLVNNNLTIQMLASYNLITYATGCSGRTAVDEAFSTAGLLPQISFTSMDTNIIKTFVRMNLGIGIIAKMEYDPIADADLKILDAQYLFNLATTMIAFHKSIFFRSYMYKYIKYMAPHLTKDMLLNSLHEKDSRSLSVKLSKAKIPVY